MLSAEFPTGWRVPLRTWTNDAVAWLLSRYGDAFDASTAALLQALITLERALTNAPWLLVIGVVAAVGWHASGRSWWVALVLAGGLFAIGTFGLWSAAMTTLAIMLVATLLTLALGIPLGIAAAGSDRLDHLLRPLLDGMQTMPSFVYLVPVVMFFGLGNVSAIVATIVYALPPVVRLTNLGLRQVDPDVLEAATAFGAGPWQTLAWVRLPLALPTIMAGVNQAIMMALAMVVVASMIGARGLGQEVLRGLQRGNVGLGLEAGLAIVILAVVMDRVTAGYARRLGAPAQGR